MIVSRRFSQKGLNCFESIANDSYFIWRSSRFLEGSSLCFSQVSSFASGAFPVRASLEVSSPSSLDAKLLKKIGTYVSGNYCISKGSGFPGQIHLSTELSRQERTVVEYWLHGRTEFAISLDVMFSPIKSKAVCIAKNFDGVKKILRSEQLTFQFPPMKGDMPIEQELQAIIAEARKLSEKVDPFQIWKEFSSRKDSEEITAYQVARFLFGAKEGVSEEKENNKASSEITSAQLYAAQEILTGGSGFFSIGRECSFHLNSLDVVPVLSGAETDQKKSPSIKKKDQMLFVLRFRKLLKALKSTEKYRNLLQVQALPATFTPDMILEAELDPGIDPASPILRLFKQVAIRTVPMNADFFNTYLVHFGFARNQLKEELLFQIMVDLKLIEENIFLERLKLLHLEGPFDASPWSEETRKALLQQSLCLEDLDAGIRRDSMFSNLEAFTVDENDTVIKDQAISVLRNENDRNSISVYVHIADPTSYFRAGSLLERAARNRLCSSQSSTLLPMEFLKLCSLDNEKINRTLTFHFEMLQDGSVISKSVFSSSIRKVKSLSFSQMSNILKIQNPRSDLESSILTLKNLSESRTLYRRKFRYEREHFHNNENRVFYEFMFLCNEFAYEFCNQLSPRVPVPRFFTLPYNSDVQPKPYAKVTSPLHRYVDLMTHFQIKSGLKKQRYYFDTKTILLVYKKYIEKEYLLGEAGMNRFISVGLHSYKETL